MAVVVLMAFTACASGGNGAARSATAEARVLPCAVRELVLRPTGFVVPMTGEHAVMYALTSRVAVTCALSGYPKVVLYDAEARRYRSAMPGAAART
jgi:hypothetical protein